ncbi:hypothetical protein F511_11583 [Dorcoceras hygrometricum]|uniref:Uncharacterized protein n=1 Tax=Dorcoceras hygrometricum TaxID=472368 RepID=A0A2Z7D5X8_9LAMI|nr:hypothetical protein F511_11583 [Dorcoceras hygrometricum]
MGVGSGSVAAPTVVSELHAWICQYSISAQLHQVLDFSKNKKKKILTTFTVAQLPHAHRAARRARAACKSRRVSRRRGAHSTCLFRRALRVYRARTLRRALHACRSHRARASRHPLHALAATHAHTSCMGLRAPVVLPVLARRAQGCARHAAHVRQPGHRPCGGRYWGGDVMAFLLPRVFPRTDPGSPTEFWTDTCYWTFLVGPKLFENFE